MLHHHEYDRKVFNLTRVPLLVCVVVVGNALPIIESPYAPGPAAFSARPSSARPMPTSRVLLPMSKLTVLTYEPLPCMPRRWGALKLFMEVVVRDEAQVLPLAYFMVDV